jgi:tRNA U34 5-methylaminomethyl-2-thiouridine-forming methyltransferase MnmC
MVTQERKLTEAEAVYYELNFTAISKNPFSEDDIEQVVKLIRELEQKNS